MVRSIAAAVGAAALALAGSAAGATVTVKIKAGGFSPSTVTIEHGDRVTWDNADGADHQVVANDGSFASPILAPGRSWTATFGTAGTFRYHDALHPKLVGKIIVKGPPPSVSLGVSPPIVPYGTTVTLSGTISSGAANQSVEVDQQPYGVASPAQLAAVKTGPGGGYSITATPTVYTTYVARWNGVASAPVVAQVAPRIRLLAGGGGYMEAVVSSPKSLWHKHVYLQRLSRFGQWVNVAALSLGPANARLFRPTAYLPRGISHVRVFLSVNQAGLGLLAGHSGTQTVRHR